MCLCLFEKLTSKTHSGRINHRPVLPSSHVHFYNQLAGHTIHTHVFFHDLIWISQKAPVCLDSSKQAYSFLLFYSPALAHISSAKRLKFPQYTSFSCSPHISIILSCLIIYCTNIQCKYVKLLKIKFLDIMNANVKEVIEQ